MKREGNLNEKKYRVRLTGREKTLLEYVKDMHGDQKRKYTGEPYYTHPMAVAESVRGYTRSDKLAIPISLCHDLIEDTEVTLPTLLQELLSGGYTSAEACHIIYVVDELTDVYTKEHSPRANRRIRKQMEADRLSKCSPLAQTIKYADLLHNTSDIVAFDEGFAKVYLEEAIRLVKVMNEGDSSLREILREQLWKAQGYLEAKI